MLIATALVMACFSGERLEAALEKAGSNRSELQTVLTHYAETGETQKHAAACFLIENMAGHNYTELVFFDSDDEPVEFDSLSFENYDEASEAMNKIEKDRGEVHYGRGEIVEDTQFISSAYLIENIDLAFQSWHTNPWSKDLSFKDFCEYVLPYRGSNEPVESWRGELMEQFAGLEAEMNDPTDAKEAGRLLEQRANAIIGFDPIFYLHPTDQGFAEMKQRKMGRCEDITNMQIYARRAGGVAVASDYTPYWAKSGNNHAWSVVIGADGKGYSPIGGVAAKVYRKTFSEQLDSLGAKLKEGEKVPRWLKGKYYKDVTKSYVTTSDVQIEVPKSDERFAYLSVFNSGHWKAIQWGEIKNNTVLFDAMGRDVLYLPSFYVGETIQQAISPFILYKDGSMRSIATTGDTVRVSTSESTDSQVTYEGMTDESVAVPLKVGKQYELKEWVDGSWKQLKIATGTDQPMEFDSLSSNGLYWLIEVEGDHEERPFTIEKGEILRW